MDSTSAKVVYCRICGIKTKKSVKIFSRRGRGMGLEQKILKCLMLSVKRSDQLPTRLCFPCIDRLDDFSQFLLHVKQAQVKLRAMLKSQGVHIKDEKNIELISTWKALLAHQERESANFERGKKRKRRYGEKVYDSSDSSSSDSVSDDLSSTGEDLPPDATAGGPPPKKIALSGSERDPGELPPKNEKSDVMCKLPTKTSEALQSAGKEAAQNSPSVTSDLNTSCNSVSILSSVPSSGSSSKVSQRQEDEITTSQDRITDVQGSAYSPYQPTTSDVINVTISPPIAFPAPVSSSMIVVPGAKLKSSSCGMVPFYIWNVPKGGSSSDAPKQSFPRLKDCSSMVAMSGEPKVIKEDLSRYALSKPFILPKATVSSTPSSETVVLLDSHNSNPLPSSKSSYITQRSIMSSSEKPGISSPQPNIDCVNEQTIIQQSGQFEAPIKTNFMVLNTSQARGKSSQRNGFPSQESDVDSEQSSCNHNLPLSSENSSQIDHNNGSQVVSEAYILSESQLCLRNLRKSMNSLHSDKSPQVISESTHEDDVKILDKRQRCSSDSSGPPLPSISSIFVTGDVTPETLRETQSSSSVKAVIPLRDTLSFKTANTLGESSVAVESIPIPRTTPTISLLTLTNSPDAPVTDVVIPSSNRTCLSRASKSPPDSGTERDVLVDDMCDIPPLIPITDSVLNKYSDAEGENSIVIATRLTSPKRSEHAVASRPLVIDDISPRKLSKSNPYTEVGGALAVKKASKCVSFGTYDINSDFTLNSDFSVVKCCLCSSGSYPFLITMASASDHCKFIHPDNKGSFGCMKCDFIAGQEKPIMEQLHSLHHHISLGCTTSNDSSVTSPSPMNTNVGSDVVEVKQEPIDVYEKALMNLKNSLRTVNMPRFRKLITSCNTNSSSGGINDVEHSSNTLQLEQSGRSAITSEGPNEQLRMREASRNRLFTNKGSTYSCRICSKKCYSKHKVKAHIARHKPEERERFIIADLCNSDRLANPTNKEALVNTLDMIFDIPPIKIEKEDSPQAIDGGSDNVSLGHSHNSVCNPIILTGDEVSKDTDKEVSSVKINSLSKDQTNCGSKKNVLHASSSGVRIPFLKGEPSKFSSAEKVTHKANPSDSFSLTPSPKGSSVGQEQCYASHPRYFRSRPIVKPLFKSPNINKDGTSQAAAISPGSSGVRVTPKIEIISPSKPASNVPQCKKAAKKLSITHCDQTSANISSALTIPTADPSLQKSHWKMRGNTNILKVIRPKPAQELNSNSTASVSISPKPKSPLPQQSDSHSKLLSDRVAVNGLVLKVPFIKLKRLNLLNIDPKLGVINHPCVGDSGGECKVNLETSKNNEDKNTKEKSCGSKSKTSHDKAKQEPSDKTEESILGW